MAEELQQLLEKIQRDGIDKANAEAKAITDKAEAAAAAAVKAAEEKAAAAAARADADAKAAAERAAVTIRQAARDVILEVQTAVTRLLENLLAKDVDAALADTAAVAPLALDAVKALGADEATVAAAAPLADALRAQFAAAAVKGVTVVTDDARGTGFSVRLDNGRVEHDFTGAAVAAALARRLRPDLAALVKSEG